MYVAHVKWDHNRLSLVVLHDDVLVSMYLDQCVGHCPSAVAHLPLGVHVVETLVQTIVGKHV